MHQLFQRANQELGGEGGVLQGKTRVQGQDFAGSREDLAADRALSFSILERGVLVVKQALKARMDAVQVEQPSNDARQRLIQSATRRFIASGVEHLQDVRRVSLVKCRDERLFIGEVLVNGADADARDFGDVVRGGGFVAAFVENASCGFDDDRHEMT